eukprot:TRINITY_DN2311_c0_g1_i3.p1 TRINITY_DN2311_c0_g1~~TRINITY_DN2311_c0_g1_i3.p1  ORF type:complete len:177 (+),score=44.38 TRINITY_DN2311_c0_g1_i3:137-667(+)
MSLLPVISCEGLPDAWGAAHVERALKGTKAKKIDIVRGGGGPPRAIITFMSFKDADTALKVLNGRTVRGCKLKAGIAGDRDMREAEEEEEDSSGLGWSSCASSPHALAPARSMYEEAVREATESRGSRFRTFTTVSALSADSPPARSGSHPLALFPSASPLLHTRSSTFFLSASRH